VKTSRRKFILGTGSAVAVSSLSSLGAEPKPATNQSPAATPAATSIIDCQSHLFSPEIVALMEKRTSDPG